MEDQEFKSFKKTLLDQGSSNKWLFLVNHSSSIGLWELPKKIAYFGLLCLSFLVFAASLWVFDIPRPALDLSIARLSSNTKSTVLSDIGTITKESSLDWNLWEASTYRRDGGYILAISTNMRLSSQDAVKIITKAYAANGTPTTFKVKGLWKTNSMGKMDKDGSVIKLLIPKAALTDGSPKILSVSLFKNRNLEAGIEIDLEKFKKRLAPEVANRRLKDDSL
jgi:hypothetical protein